MHFIFTTFIDNRESQSCIFIVKLLWFFFSTQLRRFFTDIRCYCAIYLFKVCDIEVLLHHISISYRENCSFVNGVKLCPSLRSNHESQIIQSHIDFSCKSFHQIRMICASVFICRERDNNIVVRIMLTFCVGV